MKIKCPKCEYVFEIEKGYGEDAEDIVYCQNCDHEIIVSSVEEYYGKDDIECMNIKSKRKKIIKKIIIEWFLFSFISILSLIMLFHMAIFAIPVLAILWTLFLFDVLYAIDFVKVKIKVKILSGLGYAFYLGGLVYIFIKFASFPFILFCLLVLLPAIIFLTIIVKKLFKRNK
jgi:hypothetical protein